ncbi:MAG: M15 family metallopeptidase [Candidatus Nanopelagicales bacterium]
MRAMAGYRVTALLVGALLVLTGCSADQQTPSPAPTGMNPAESATPVPAATESAEPRADAEIRRIPDEQWSAMRAAGVVRPGCPATREDLRRVEVNFHTFGGGVRRGVLVVNVDVSDDVAAIFTQIFKSGFPIRSMRPIEKFDGDDNASMAADNTSAYNCRSAAQANSNPADSPHANGRAVDINPRENPWLDPRCDCFMPTAEHAARTPGKGKILEGGRVWRAFTQRGWIWQDIATPDYQHFDTGYPSRPR